MSHAACGECNSRCRGHGRPLETLLPKAPFAVVTWVLGRKLLTCCQSDREAPKRQILPRTVPPALVAAAGRGVRKDVRAP